MTIETKQARFILYACPLGGFADQLEQFYAESSQTIGRTPAQDYMPHSSLTGFFIDTEINPKPYIDSFVPLLDKHLADIPTPPITITNLKMNDLFIGFELEAQWIKDMVRTWKNSIDIPTLLEPIRPKDWLHLSLAYKFPEEKKNAYTVLAQKYFPELPASEWEIRFYQRNGNDGNHTWTCHQTWQLAALEETANS